LFSLLKHDIKASINVLFEALPLCIGIALASGVSIYSGFIAAIIGGTIVTLLSGSNLCIRGPATGLITICVTALALVGNNYDYFFAAVAIAGLFQILLGSFNMGGFTYFIPSVVVKGMMASIGIMLIIQQIPFAIGDIDIDPSGKVSFFHFLSIRKIVDHSFHIWQHLSPGVVIITMFSIFILYVWEKKFSKKFDFIPAYLIVVILAVIIAYSYTLYFPQLALSSSQYITIPHNLLEELQVIHIPAIFVDTKVWRAAILICIVSSLISFVTVEAIDKLDPHNRLTPRNQELVAQGTGNLLSGMLGGLPIVALIARSTTNLESGARTKLSGFFQGIWLLIAAMFIPFLIPLIPYSVLAVIIIKIGFKLANPSIFIVMYKAGKTQFVPFMVTLFAILFTDVLFGLLLGITYSFYSLVKNNYKAEYFLNEDYKGHIKHYTLKLTGDVSFLNKKGIVKLLDDIPSYSILEIIGPNGGNIDYDILEVIDQYKSKAHHRHIELILKDIPDTIITAT
jgi:MFS superfamily sulfate permease-like transporter